MCKPGNQSIYKECRDALLGIGNAPPMRNAEMRRVLAAHGGCMNGQAQHENPGVTAATTQALDKSCKV